MAVIGSPRNRMVTGAVRPARVPTETTPEVPGSPSTPLGRMARSEYYRGQTGVLPTGTTQEDIDMTAGTAAGEGFTVNVDFGGTTRSGGGTSASRSYGKERAYLRKELASGKWRTGLDELLAKIEEQKATQRAAAETSFGAAKTQAGAAYDALKAYLEANPSAAYANLPQAVAPNVQNALAQYMTAQGAPTTQAEAAVSLANVLGAGSTANYQNLINTLRAAETARNLARVGEAQTARTYTEQQLANALAARQAQIDAETAAARVAAEQSAFKQRQALLDRLRALSGY